MTGVKVQIQLAKYCSNTSKSSAKLLLEKNNKVQNGLVCVVNHNNNLRQQKQKWYTYSLPVLQHKRDQLSSLLLGGL